MLKHLKVMSAMLLAIGCLALVPVAASAAPSARVGHAVTTVQMRPADNWWYCGPGGIGSQCDNTDPYQTGCASTGIKEQWTSDFSYPGNTARWYVAVYYSPACHTAWAKLIRDSGSGSCDGCAISVVRDNADPGLVFGPTTLYNGAWTNQYDLECGHGASAWVSQSWYGVIGQMDWPWYPC